MARSPHCSRPDGLRRPHRPLLAVAAVVFALLCGLGSAPVGAVDAATGAPALGAVMDGDVDALSASALTDFAAAAQTMRVSVTVVNDTGQAQPVAVPFGTLLATEAQADQTVAVAGPADTDLTQLAAFGGTPEIVAPPGESTHALTVFCTEADDGAPMTPTPLTHVGLADEPLPTVLRNIAAAAPRDEVAQDAVWWVTDDATLPVPADIAPLLEGVDTAAFAGAPRRVVPDTGYTPRWARAGVVDESFDGGASTPIGSSGSGSGLRIGLWVMLIAAGVVALIVVATRQSSRAGAPVAARTQTGTPGWYPDPWAAGNHRWWDGRSWTSRTRRLP